MREGERDPRVEAGRAPAEQEGDGQGRTPGDLGVVPDADRLH